MKAYLYAKTDPSWLPTLHMGYDIVSAPTGERHARLAQRGQKRKIADAVSSLLTLGTTDTPSDHCPVDQQNRSQSQSPISEAVVTVNENMAAKASDAVVQTVLSCDDIAGIEADNRARLLQPGPTTSVYDREWYVNDPEKVHFYTSVPSLAVLHFVYDTIKCHLSEAMKLSRYQQLLVCLVKLRMNYLFRDIAYQLNVSVGTVQRVFHYALNALYVELDFLIQWPSRENLRKSMPMSFCKEFGNKVVVVIDCFELFTEKPSGAMNTVLTYSNYKHHQTVKYLIGIAPQGPVTFISRGWGGGGRTFDKHRSEVWHPVTVTTW